MRFARVSLSGNPDRICDLIASGIADEYLKRDPDSRIVCQVSGGKGAVFVTGEVLSQADFDVARLVQRLLGKHGIYEQTESFIALETVASENVGRFRTSCVEPAVVAGYATKETPSALPKPLHLAVSIAKALEQKRKQDPDWFWLGTTGYVSVMGQADKLTDVVIEIESGTELVAAKSNIQSLLSKQFTEEQMKVTVNALGRVEKQGLNGRIGRSGTDFHAYGFGLPSGINIAGRDWHSVEVYGQWLARGLAKRALERSDAQAVLAELSFMPGDELPSRIAVRDERGRPIGGSEDLKRAVCEKLAAWRQPGVMERAVSGLMFSEPDLPWEVSV